MLVELLKLVRRLEEGCLKMGPLFILLVVSRLAWELEGVSHLVSSLQIDRLLFGGSVNSDWSLPVGGLFV